MSFRWTGSGRSALAVVALMALATRSEAQSAGTMGRGGMAFPQFSAQGDWAEVVTVTPKWLVLQNQQGQQFPVSLSRDTVNLFLIRWPTSPNRLPADAWVEAIGLNGNSNQILTDHVDVFQGATKSLAPVPMRETLNQRGQFVLPPQMDSYETSFGDNFQRGPADRLTVYTHVVGPVVNRSPLTVGSPDNVIVTVLGPQGSPPMSLITFGTSSFVRAGDLVWYLVSDSIPRSLVLTQLMVYKNVPLDQYAP